MVKSVKKINFTSIKNTWEKSFEIERKRGITVCHNANDVLFVMFWVYYYLYFVRSLKRYPLSLSLPSLIFIIYTGVWGIMCNSI